MVLSGYKELGQDILLGSWITLGHFSIAEIMAQAGFNWLCIDLEHSVIDYYEMEQLIAIIYANNCVPYVRVSANDPVIIKRALDAGAKGIIVPMINSKIDAEKANIPFVLIKNSFNEELVNSFKGEIIRNFLGLS